MRISPFTQSAGLPRSLPSHTPPLKFADGNTSGTLSISSHGLAVGYDDGEQCQRSSCSVRLEGPVILVGFRGTSKGCLRPKRPILVPTERCPPAGEYRIWLACSHARIGAKGAGRSLIDTGALVGAFSEREQVDGSPFVVSIPDRWCEGISSLSGVPHPWAELAHIHSRDGGNERTSQAPHRSSGTPTPTGGRPLQRAPLTSGDAKRFSKRCRLVSASNITTESMIPVQEE